MICDVVPCGAEVYAKAACKPHYERLRLGRSMWNGKSNPRKNILTYGGAHSRVRKARGSAVEYSCVDCGKQASEWSYDHSDPSQVVGLTSRGHEAAYSMDPAHYSPRCKSCHAVFDSREYKW